MFQDLHVVAHRAVAAVQLLVVNEHVQRSDAVSLKNTWVIIMASMVRTLFLLFAFVQNIRIIVAVTEV